MPRIHPTALVHPDAQLADDVEVGAYSIIDAHVQIGAGTVVGPHVVINGHTTIGARNRFFQFCSIGEANQDKKYKGEPTRTRIGDDNVFRENCTVHRGTVQDASETRIGNDNLFMASSHVAHDCVIGDHCILANLATLAGHVHLQDHVILGGFVGVHQFCHIGAHAFVGMKSGVHKDVPPYVMADGLVADPRGINSEGLKRRGFSPERILQIKRAYKTLYRNGLTLEEASTQLAVQAEYDADAAVFAAFLQNSKRGVIR